MGSRPSLLLSLLIPAYTLDAQYTGLATNFDGSVLYFSTALRQAGTDQPLYGKIFRVDTDGVHLYAVRARDPLPTGPSPSHLTNFYDLFDPDVSADGTVVTFTGRADCSGQCSLVAKRQYTVRRDNVESVELGRAKLSSIGRYILAFGPPHSTCCSSGVAVMTDLLTGHSVSVDNMSDNRLLAGRVLSDDGTFAGYANVAGGRAVQTYSPLDASIVSRVVEPNTITDVVLDASGTYLVYTHRWAPPNSSLRRIRYYNLRDRSYGTAAEFDLHSCYSPRISDDASNIIFLSDRTGAPQVWESNFPSGTPRQITNNASGVANAILSGDGRVAYATTYSGALLRIALNDLTTTEIIGRTPSVEPDSGILGTYYTASPGSLVRIKGTGFVSEPKQAPTPFPTELGGLRVFLGDVAVPIVSATPGEVLIQIPWEFPAGATNFIPIRITTDASPTFDAGPTQILVVAWEGPATPWFAPASSGVSIGGEAVPLIFNADFSVQITPDSPARPGQQINLLATSLGRVNVTVRTGELTPAAPLPTLARTLDCNLNGAKVDVRYAGLMPGLAGIYQLSILIPAEFPLGATWGGTIGAPPLKCFPVPRSELDSGSFQADIPVEF